MTLVRSGRVYSASTKADIPANRFHSLVVYEHKTPPAVAINLPTLSYSLLDMMTPTTSLIAAVVIRVAPNLINEIIGQLRDDVPSLRQCSLVSKKWRGESLKWLFAVIAVEITVADPWSYLRWTGEPVPGKDGETTN